MKKILCTLLCLVIFAGCGEKQEVESKQTEVVVENKQQLSELNNIYYYDKLSDLEKTYYDCLLKASENHSNIVSGNVTLDTNAFHNALYAFSYDYPLYYWWRNGLKLSYTDNSFEGYSSESNDEINKNIELLETKKDEILKNCKVENNYQTVKNIHDYIINNVTYNTEDPNAHDIAGSLINGNSVCDGYSLAFKYLLNAAGFNCIACDGHAIENDEMIEHGWNFVELNNEWYQTDLTWDDPIYANDSSAHLIYDYFLISDEMMSMDHFINENYEFPKCTDESLFYVNMSGTYFKSFDETVITNKIIDWINSGNNHLYLKFKSYEDGINAYKWLLEGGNFANIFQKCNNSNYDITYGGDYNNNSHVLHIYYEYQ